MAIRSPSTAISAAARNRRGRRLALLVFAASLLLVLASVGWLQARHRTQMLEAARQINHQAGETVERRFYQYQRGLRGLRGALLAAGAEDIQAAQLDRYSNSRDLEQEFPGAGGFGYIGRVAAQDVPAYTAALRRSAGSDFAVRQLAAHDGERYVIQYITPLERNRSALGLDIASEANRRTAAETAARTGAPTLTAPITLLQAADKPGQSMLFLLPVYGTPKAPATERERIASVIGWTYAPLLIGDVLGTELVSSEVRLTLADVTDPPHPQLFYSSGEGAAQPGLASATSERIVFGRTWRFTTTLLPGYAAKAGYWPAWAIILPGAILSALLAALALAASDSRERARQLSQARAEMAGIVESSPDAIVGRTLEGIVTSWNRGAEQLFGYAAQEAIGQPLTALIVPDGRSDEEAHISASVKSGGVLGHFQTVRRRKDGTLFHASVSAAPIRDAHGTVVGASKAVRDITAQKQAEERIVSLNENLEELIAQRTGELEQARRTLRTVLDALPSMIGYWDAGLVNHVANRAYEERFGLAPGSLPGRNLRDLLEPDELDVTEPYIGRVLAGQPQTFDRAIRRRDGRVYHGLAHFIPDVVDGEVRGFFAIIHDVTEISEKRLQLASALQENRMLLDAIDSQMLFSTTGLDGIITSVNRNFCTAHGYQPEDLIGKSHGVLRSGLHDADFYGGMWSTLRQGQAWRGEISNRTRDGRLCWFDTVIAPARDSAGRVQGYVSLRIDISARKRADAEVARLNDLLNNVLQAASEMSVIATDPDGLITVFNSGAERMLGYAAAEMVGRQSPALIHLADEVAQRGSELSAECGAPIGGFQVFVHVPQMRGQETRHWTYVRKDGSRLTVSLTVTAMRTQGGELAGFLGIATDVTRQLRQQRELAASRDQLALAADVARLGVWTFTVADQRLQWNRHMFAMYDQPDALAESGLGYQHWRERLHPDDVARAEALFQQALDGTAEFNPVFRICLRDGSVRHIQAGAQVERDGAGQPVRVTGINVDISERTAYEASLFEAKRLAEQASVVKSQFLANMSHEIRTPLNATLGMLELLRRSSLTERQEDYAAKAQSAATSLLGLLNDILDYSKIEAGKLQLDPHPFELDALMRDLGVVLAANLGGKEVELVYDIDARLPRVVSGDRLRLQQVLINIAGNAIKFTSSGQVVVRLEYRALSGGELTVGVSVTDSGIGISEEQAQRIFDAFSQAEASTTRRYGGTGLGLAISRRLVNLMGGELALRSKPGKGSQFRFDMQMQVVDPRPLDGQTIESRLGRQPRILVVDDNPVSRQVLSATAQAFGWSAALAASGEAAVAAVGASGAAPYDLVLMDWRMPGIDGGEAARRIGAVAPAGTLPVVIMVTGHGREVLRDAGQQGAPPFSAVLDKPVTPAQILAAFGAAIGAEDAVMGGLQAPARPQRRLDGIAVLVVEDNPLNRQVAYELLVGAGADVQMAEGGEQGVRMATADGAAIDVVLMDVQMPDIDGYEATRRIHAHARGRQLPVIAMTANASRVDRDECLAAGMCEHIGKPFVIGDVVDAILLAAHGGAPRATLAAAGGGGGSSDGADDELIDSWASIMRRFNHDHAIYGNALGGFYPECRRMLDLLRLPSVATDPGAAGKHLHNLKGMAATVGASALARLAAQLEHGLKDGAPEVLSAEVLQRLAQLADASRDALDVLLREAAPRAAPSAGQVRLAQAEWQARLATLLHLLDASDMQAIDHAEALADLAPEPDAGWADQLRGCVMGLQFAEAAALIQHYLAAADGGASSP